MEKDEDESRPSMKDEYESKPRMKDEDESKPRMKDEDESKPRMKEINYGSISSHTSSPAVSLADVDDAVDLIGNCGRFQIFLHILLFYLVVTIGYHFVLGVFVGDDPPWKCVTHNSTHFCLQYYGYHISKDSELFYQRCQLNRDEWTYSQPKGYSFVTEFDLVCESTAVAAVIRASFYIGGLIGSFVSGTLADTFGRKLVILLSLTVTICFSIGCAFAKSVLQLSILRGILGAAHVSCYFTGYVYLSEFAAPKHRTLTANLYVMSLTLSQMLIDLFAYFERNWRHLQLYASFPCILALIVFCFMPESPRWLLATNKKSQAQTVLERIAVFNGKLPGPIRLKELPYEKRYSYIDLIRNWKVLKLTLAIGAQWMTIALVYYSVALESSSLGGNMYQAFALLALADFPSYFLSFYICKRYGRKRTILVCLITGSILNGSISLVPSLSTHRYKVIMVLVVLLKFCICVSFNVIYPWTFELFPTVLRSQGISLCVVFERIGLVAVPFLTTLLQRVSYNSPFLFMCGLAISSSMIGLLLPETNNKPTREKYGDFFTKNEAI